MLTMFTRRFTTMAALVALMMLGAIMPASAQMDSTPESNASPSSDLSDINEPDAIYGRFFMADTNAMTTDATPATDMEGMPPIVAIVQVYEFASDEDAEAALEPLNQALIEEIGATDAETENVDDLGNMAVRSSGTVDESGIQANLTSLSVQQDNLVYVTVVGTMDDSSADVATDIADHMLNTEPGDAEVVFNMDGTSTGGYFDVFPVEGDDLVQGMTVSEDMYTGSEADAASAATPTS